MTDPTPTQPRVLIRRAIVRVLQESPVTAPLFGGQPVVNDDGEQIFVGARIYPNREEHWQADELPACGVYTLSEEILDSDTWPDPGERRIDLIIEILSRKARRVDDTLDALTGAIESALSLDAIGDAMGRIANEALIAAGLRPMEKIKKDGVWRWPVDTLLLLGLKGTDLGIAVDGDRQIGVAAMNYDLEYSTATLGLPPYESLPDFLLAMAGWDVEPHDGVIDMESRVELEPTTKE